MDEFIAYGEKYSPEIRECDSDTLDKKCIGYGRMKKINEETCEMDWSLCDTHTQKKTTIRHVMTGRIDGTNSLKVQHFSKGLERNRVMLNISDYSVFLEFMELFRIRNSIHGRY